MLFVRGRSPLAVIFACECVVAVGLAVYLGVRLESYVLALIPISVVPLTITLAIQWDAFSKKPGEFATYFAAIMFVFAVNIFVAWYLIRNGVNLP